KYDNIEREILSEVRGKAADLYGIQVKSIGMERLALPQRITETVFDAMKKKRQAEGAKFPSEGDSPALEIKSKAEGNANTILAFADRKEKEIINEGLAQANKYYKVFQEDEGLATFLMKVETLPKLLKEKSTTVVFDQTSPLLDPLFTPTPATQPAANLAGHNGEKPRDQKGMAAAAAVIPQLKSGE